MRKTEKADIISIIFFMEGDSKQQSKENLSSTKVEQQAADIIDKRVNVTATEDPAINVDDKVTLSIDDHVDTARNDAKTVIATNNTDNVTETNATNNDADDPQNLTATEPTDEVINVRKDADDVFQTNKTDYEQEGEHSTGT